MSISYRYAQEINAQVILWAILGVAYTAGCALSRLSRRITQAISLPLLLRILAYSLAGAVVGAPLLAVFALVVAQPAFAAGLLGLLAVAYATYPR